MQGLAFHIQELLRGQLQETDTESKASKLLARLFSHHLWERDSFVGPIQLYNLHLLPGDVCESLRQIPDDL